MNTTHPELYAIGDVHGDPDRAIELLKEHGLLDTDGHWQAGTAQLVFVGDLTDRGPWGLTAIQLVMRLEAEAEEAGGKVHCLMGNHDALILSRAHEHKTEQMSSECQFCFEMNGGHDHEAEALAKDENKGLFNWLSARPLLVKVNDVLFQHVDGYEYYLSLGLCVEDVVKSGLVKSSTFEGCWDLFYNLTDERVWHEQRSNDNLIKYLDMMGAKKVVHGHTRLGRKAEAPFTYRDGLAVNVDASLSRGYGLIPDRGCVWKHE